MKLNDEWAAAFNKSDAGAVAALYTADANALPARAPNGEGP
jgi:ketosteroid isomerase-like protein